ncbi:LOW QUALITY PROTEIN: ankyrin and armadillo repeat-containing protein [Morus bassanus]
MSSSWLASKDDTECSVEIAKVHQILRELAVGICCPSISSDANYYHRISCQLPPAIDTKIGQILISVDYMAGVWGIYIQREMCQCVSLQQRLALQQKLLKKQLEKITAICRNIEYLKLMNLIPFLRGFKKKMEIPNLSKVFSPILTQLIDMDMPDREYYSIPVMEFDGKR